MDPFQLDRPALSLSFQSLLPGSLGEVTHAALYWDRGGTHTLERLRKVSDLHLLVMCLEGQADYVDARKVSRVIRPGMIMLIPRGLAHSYRPTPGHRWSEIHAWLRGPLPDLWWRQNFLGPGLSLLQAEPLADAAFQICGLLGKAKSGANSNDERLSALQRWLAQLKDDAALTGGDRDRKAPWLVSACLQLERGTMREPSLGMLAGKSCVSYETFRKSFVALVGTSPGQYRVAAVVRQACRLLRSGVVSNKEIAARLEFSDEFHFAHAFRRRMGLTPRDYRARTKEDRNEIGATRARRSRNLAAGSGRTKKNQ